MGYRSLLRLPLNPDKKSPQSVIIFRADSVLPSPLPAEGSPYAYDSIMSVFLKATPGLSDFKGPTSHTKTPNTKQIKFYVLRWEYGTLLGFLLDECPLKRGCAVCRNILYFRAYNF